MTAEERFLRVILPRTIPKIIQTNKTLMVYNEFEDTVGCFFSVEECAKFFKTDGQKISQTIFFKSKLYSKYTIRWVTTGYHKITRKLNNGEII
jgi:hypothetical protein